MRRPDHARALVGAPWLLLTAFLALLVLPSARADGDVPTHRWRAPLVVDTPGVFVQLDVPASAYGHSRQPGLADLRIVDAGGQRVPFAWLAAARPAAVAPSLRAVALYPLPARAPGGDVPMPWTLRVQGDSLQIQPAPAARGGSTAAPAMGSTGSTGSAGWLIDLGAPAAGAAAPRAVRLAWSGPAEFSAPYTLAVSADLRQWQDAGAGQLMALAPLAQGMSQSTARPISQPISQPIPQPITQPDLPLPPDAPRFVRLIWQDAADAPRLSGAQAVIDPPPGPSSEPLTPLTPSPSPEPTSKGAPGQPPAGALHLDLGGPLPLASIDLDPGPGSRVLPLRVQGRQTLDQPWRDLTQGVAYRLQRGADQDARRDASPPLALDATARYLRLLPDERAGPLDARQTKVIVQARLGSLVFAAQGQPPHALLAGADDPRPGALPLATLVPALDSERPRFGRARVGEWAEAADVARQAAAAERRAALRPWLLWAVLLLGVAALGAMVWRLMRGAAKGSSGG